MYGDLYENIKKRNRKTISYHKNDIKFFNKYTTYILYVFSFYSNGLNH